MRMSRTWVAAVVLAAASVTGWGLPICQGEPDVSPSYIEYAVLDHEDNIPAEWCDLINHEYQYDRSTYTWTFSNGVVYICTNWYYDKCVYSYNTLHSLPVCGPNTCFYPLGGP